GPQATCIRDGHSGPLLVTRIGPPCDRRTREQPKGSQPRFIELWLGHVTDCPLQAGHDVVGTNVSEPPLIVRAYSGQVCLCGTHRDSEQRECRDGSCCPT